MVKKVLDFYVFSKLSVAVSVSALSCVSFYVFGSEINYTVLGFIFFSTLTLYSFHLWWGIKSIKYDLVFERHIWAKNHDKILFSVIFLSFLFTLFFAVQLFRDAFYLIIPVGVISVGYSIPFYKGKRFRDIQFAKIFLITSVVSVVVVLLPAIFSNSTSLEMFSLLTAQCFFLFAITIPFDLRDIEVDKAEIKTLPMILGKKRIKILAIVSLLISALIGVLLLPLKIVFIINTLIAIIAVVYSGNNKSEYYYSLVIEGTLITQFVMVYIESSLIY